MLRILNSIAEQLKSYTVDYVEEIATKTIKLAQIVVLFDLGNLYFNDVFPL